MEYKLSQPVDLTKVQTLPDLLHDATGISALVVDPDGAALADSGWQEACRHFRWVNPETREYCRHSGTSIAFAPLAIQNDIIEPCRNGLVDAAAPVTVPGQQVAHFVAGHFLTQPYIGSFKRQALQLSFDDPAYMRSLPKVPIIDEAKLRTFLQCFSILTEVLGEADVRNIAEVRTAPRIFLEQGEEDRSELEWNTLSNVKDLTLPYVEKLKKSGLSPEQTAPSILSRPILRRPLHLSFQECRPEEKQRRIPILSCTA